MNDNEQRKMLFGYLSQKGIYNDEQKFNDEMDSEEGRRGLWEKMSKGGSPMSWEEFDENIKPVLKNSADKERVAAAEVAAAGNVGKENYVGEDVKVEKSAAVAQGGGQAKVNAQVNAQNSGQVNGQPVAARTGGSVAGEAGGTGQADNGQQGAGNAQPVAERTEGTEGDTSQEDGRGRMVELSDGSRMYTFGISDKGYEHRQEVRKWTEKNVYPLMDEMIAEGKQLANKEGSAALHETFGMGALALDVQRKRAQDDPQLVIDAVNRMIGISNAGTDHLSKEEKEQWLKDHGVVKVSSGKDGEVVYTYSDGSKKSKEQAEKEAWLKDNDVQVIKGDDGQLWYKYRKTGVVRKVSNGVEDSRFMQELSDMAYRQVGLKMDKDENDQQMSAGNKGDEPLSEKEKEDMSKLYSWRFNQIVGEVQDDMRKRLEMEYKPTGWVDYVVGGGLRDSMTGRLIEMLFDKANGDRGLRAQLRAAAEEDYIDNLGFWGGSFAMAGKSAMAISADAPYFAVGSLYGNALGRLAGRGIARAVGKKGMMTAMKYIPKVVSSGWTFGNYDAMSTGIEQARRGKLDIGELLSSWAGGFGTGAVLGGMNEKVGRIARNVESRFGKIGTHVGGYAGEVALFSGQEWMSEVNALAAEKNISFDEAAKELGWQGAEKVVFKQAAMIGMLKAKGWAEGQLKRRQMLQRANMIQPEILADLEPYREMLNGKRLNRQTLNQVRELKYNGQPVEEDVQGEERLQMWEKMMQDPNVSAEAKRAATFIMFGEIGMLNPVTKVDELIRDTDGVFRIVRRDDADNVISRREFRDSASARAEHAKASREAQLNRIWNSEGAVADASSRMTAAMKSVAESEYMSQERIMAVMNGEEGIENGQRAAWAQKIVDKVNETAKQMAMDEGVKGIAEIRSEIEEELGVDIDNALKEKNPTAEQAAAVNEYENRLNAVMDEQVKRNEAVTEELKATEEAMKQVEAEADGLKLYVDPTGQVYSATLREDGSKVYLSQYDKDDPEGLVWYYDKYGQLVDGHFDDFENIEGMDYEQHMQAIQTSLMEAAKKKAQHDKEGHEEGTPVTFEAGRSYPVTADGVMYRVKGYDEEGNVLTEQVELGQENGMPVVKVIGNNAKMPEVELKKMMDRAQQVKAEAERQTAEKGVQVDPEDVVKQIEESWKQEEEDAKKEKEEQKKAMVKKADGMIIEGESGGKKTKISVMEVDENTGMVKVKIEREGDGEMEQEVPVEQLMFVARSGEVRYKGEEPAGEAAGTGEESPVAEQQGTGLREGQQGEGNGQPVAARTGGSAYDRIPERVNEETGKVEKMYEEAPVEDTRAAFIERFGGGFAGKEMVQAVANDMIEQAQQEMKKAASPEEKAKAFRSMKYWEAVRDYDIQQQEVEAQTAKVEEVKKVVDDVVKQVEDNYAKEPKTFDEVERMVKDAIAGVEDEETRKKVEEYWNEKADGMYDEISQKYWEDRIGKRAEELGSVKEALDEMSADDIEEMLLDMGADQMFWLKSDANPSGFKNTRIYKRMVERNSSDIKKIMEEVAEENHQKYLEWKERQERMKGDDDGIRFRDGDSEEEDQDISDEWTPEKKKSAVESVMDYLKRAERFISHTFNNGISNKRFTIELPLNTRRMIRRKMGRDFDSHNIDINGVRHGFKNHGVNGRKLDEKSIPVRVEDLNLIPYIMTAPTYIEKGSNDFGRESIRFVKVLDNGTIVVVEKEQKNSADNLDTINIWASLSDVAYAQFKRTDPSATSEHVTISSSDVAKIRKDAEIVIQKEAENVGVEVFFDRWKIEMPKNESQDDKVKDDEKYLQAVQSGDMETAQRMVMEKADAEISKDMQLASDEGVVGFQYHRGAAPKKVRTMYAVLNVTPEGFKAAYAGNKTGTPVGVWLDAVPLKSWESDKKKNDDGSYSRYVAGDTGASWTDMFTPERYEQMMKEDPTITKGTRWLYERGGKHGTDVPNFSQMNTRTNEAGEKVRSGKEGALPHNKLIFEIECGMDEDGDLTSYVAENGRFVKKKNQGMAWVGENKFYFFKTNPNAVGNWGIAGTFRIKRLVPHDEIVRECEKAGVPVQKWIGGYHPEDSGLSVEMVDEMYKEGKKKKLMDPVTYDDNGNVIPLSQRFSGREDMRFRDDNNGQPVAARTEQSKNGFFSPAEKAVREVKQEKATGEQWLKMIEKAGGLKKEEDKWMGLSDWLREQSHQQDPKPRPTKINVKGREYDVKELEDELMQELQYRINEEYGYDDAEIVGVRLVGSYMRGEEHKGSDLDLIMEFRGDAREDDLFNEINNDEDRITVNGIEVDVNPITEGKSGTIDEWEKRNAGFTKKPRTITKQEVLDFIRENKVEIKEVNYAEGVDNDQKDWEFKKNIEDALQAEFDDYVLESEDMDPEQIYMAYHYDYAMDRLFEKYGNDFFNRSGANIEVDDEYTSEDLAELAGKLGIEVPKYDEQPINDTRLMYTTDGLENKREIALVIPSVEEYEGNSPEIHFADDATNGKAVGWCRFGDYVDNEGKRVLVIDEIQSQRHQDGREKGYTSKELSDARNAFKKASDELRDFQMKMQRKYGREVSSMITEEEKAERDRLAKISGEAENRMLEAAKNTNISGVPDAPFQKNWHELVMKRMLRYAAENGYDRVAWTDGETQAERYNIGGMVPYIDIKTDLHPAVDERAMWKTMRFEANGRACRVDVNTDGKVIFTEGLGDGIEGKHITDVFGKEVGKRIMESEPTERIQLEGQRIGGEGMIGFYDQMLPRWMNKYGKKWGVQVGEEFMEGLSDGQSGYSVENEGKNGLRMWSVPVTEEMKESVMDGQPMWRRGDSPAAEQQGTGQEEVTGGWKVNSRDDDKRHIEEAVVNNGNRLNVKVNVLRKGDEAQFSENIQRRLRRGSKGFYNPNTGEVYVYLENATNVGDAVKTLLHEIVGHKGLRELIGKERFDEAMVDMYKELPDEVKSEIDTLAQKKYKGNVAVAMDEYFAGKAEEGVTPTWWGKVTGAFRTILKDVLGMDLELSDGDIKYLLWKSYKGLRGEKDMFDVAEDVAMRFKNKVGEYAEKAGEVKDRIMERSGDVTKTNNFKNWFGDWEKDPENASKVVDEEGRPEVQKHATRKGNKGFSVFDTQSDEKANNNIGSHFGISAAEDIAENDKLGGSSKDDVYEVYLDIKNPYETYDWFAQDDCYPLWEAMRIVDQHELAEGQDILEKVVKDEIAAGNKWIGKMWKAYQKGGVDEVEELVEEKYFKGDTNGLYTGIRKILKMAGYDGLKYFNDLEGNGMCWIALEPEQIKSAEVGGDMENNGEFSRKNKDIRYAGEGDKSLVGMHNISEDQLRKVLKMGGLANPSTAIIDIDKQDHERYGGISLVMPSRMVDSRTGNHGGTNAADIYSPNYPQVYKRFSDQNEAKMRDKIAELGGKYVGEMNVWGNFSSKLENGQTGGLEYIFAKMKGADVDSFKHGNFDSFWEPYMKYYDGFELRQAMNEDPELAQKITKHFYDKEVSNTMGMLKMKVKKNEGESKFQYFDRLRGLAKKAADMLIDEDGQWNWRLIDNEFNSQKEAYTKNGDFDYWGTNYKVSDYITENKLWDEYNKWEEEFVNQFEPQEMLYNGRDNDGNAKWVANTLNNASKMMKKQGKLNADRFFETSMGGVRAGFTPLMKTLEEIRDNKWRLDKEKFEEQKEVLEQQYTELAILFDKSGGRDFDSKYYNLIDAMKSGNAKKWADKNGFNISKEDGKAIDNFAIALKEMPTEYFELKFERPVKLNEFSGAVVPRSAGDDIKQALKDAGLEIFEYDPEVEGDRRRAALEASDMEGVRFRFVGERAAENDEQMKKDLEMARRMEKEDMKDPDEELSMEDREALGLGDEKSWKNFLDKNKRRRIKMATGWERGADGKWRYETPDFESKVDMFGRAEVKGDKDYKRMQQLVKKTNGFAFGLNEDLTDEEKKEYAELKNKYKDLGMQVWQKADKLYKFVKDDMLFKLYPKMRDVEVSFKDMKENEKGALIEPSLDDILDGTAVLPFRIELNSRLTEEEATRVLAHEIQHGVQMMEGFARGGNVESSINKLREIGHKMGIKKGEKRSIMDMKRMTDYLNKDVYNNLLEEALENGYGSIEEWIDGLSPYTYYHRLAGEVEARNVQKRMDMTPEERRKSLAEETEDVPRSKQVVEFDGDGVSSFMAGEEGAQTLDEFMKERVKKLKWVEKMEKWLGKNGKYSMKNDRIKWEQKFGQEGEQRMKNLKVAIRMAKQKKSAKDIKMATGWEQGKDNKWRYEISDAGIHDKAFKRLNNINDEKFDVVARLADVVNAPELFTAYPSLQDTPVHFYRDDNSSYLGFTRGRQIWINTSDFMKVKGMKADFDADVWDSLISNEHEGMNETINHEIQHIIQDIEGFAEGGNTESVRKLLKNIIDDRKWENEDNKKRMEQHGMLIHDAYGLKNSKILLKNPKKYLKWMDSYKHSGTKEQIIAAGQEWAVDAYLQAMDHIQYDAERFGIDPKQYGLDMEDYDRIVQNRYDNGATPEDVAKSLIYWDEAVKVYEAIIKASYKEIEAGEIVEDVKRYEDVKSKLEKIYSDSELYNVLAGEVEARVVSKRMGMSPEERRQRPSIEDEDVSRSEQIAVKWGGLGGLMGEEKSHAAESQRTGQENGQPVAARTGEDEIRWRDDESWEEKSGKGKSLGERSRRLLEDEPIDWRDYVLISVGGGMKFRMSDSGLTKSIVKHLTGRSADIPPFMRDNTNGYLPEKAAEKIWGDMPEGMREQCTDQDVFNEITSIIGTYRNYNEMLDVSARAHWGTENAGKDEYEEEMKDAWAQDQGYASYKDWEAEQIWSKMGFKNKEEMLDYEDMLEQTYGKQPVGGKSRDLFGKETPEKVISDKEKKQIEKDWLRAHGFGSEAAFEKWKESMEEARRQLWKNEDWQKAKAKGMAKYLKDLGFASEEEYQKRMDELWRKHQEGQKLTEKRKKALEEKMAEYEGEFEYNADGMPEAPEYSRSGSLDEYLDKMDKYNEVLRLWSELHPEHAKAHEESRRIVQRAVNKALSSDSVGDMGKRELNKIMTAVRTAKADNLSDVVQDALRAVNKVVVRSQQEKIDKLLKMKVQDMNGKNMSIAKNVDDATRRIVEKLREFANGDHDLQGTKEAIDKLYDKMDNHVKRLSEAAADGDTSRAAEDPTGENTWTEEDSEILAALQVVQRMDEGKATQRDLDGIEDQLAKAKQQLDDLSAAWADGEFAGSREQYMAKRRYWRNRIKALNQKASSVSHQRIQEQESLLNDLSELIEGGKNSLKDKVENEQARRLSLLNGAFGDINGSGKRVNVQEAGQYLHEKWYKKIFTAALSSFEYMAQSINTRGLGRDGYIYRYFVSGKDGVVEANNVYSQNMRANIKTLDNKCEEIYGKGKTFAKVTEQNEKVMQHTGIYVSDPNDPDHPEALYEMAMSKGQATYAYMVWKMKDGQAQLRLQGFSDQTIDEIKDFIGEQNVQWADWVQKELLQDLRERYNDKYVEMYNTSLAEVENYVPLKRVKEMTRQDSDLSGNSRQQSHSLVEKAGSLINRRNNDVPVALTNSAFDVVFEHINQMEEWNAFAKVRKDLDYLLGSAYFRNQMNRNSKGAFERFEKAAEIAAHAERRTGGSNMDEVIATIQKGLVGAPIAYRNTTALKQMLSVPAFLGYSQDPRFVAAFLKNVIGQYGGNAPAIIGNMVTFGTFGKRMFKNRAEMEGRFRGAMTETIGWCMNNVPDYYDRVNKMHGGDSSLDDTLTSKIGKIIDKYLEQGMISNQMVDAVTCAIGIKTIYDFKMARVKDMLKKMDLTPEARKSIMEEEHRKAVMEATIYYNGTQQSNHKAFLSPMQVSKTMGDRMMSVYQNASIGFARRFVTALQDMKRLGDWNRQVRHYTRRLMENANALGNMPAGEAAGKRLTEEQARTMAQKYLRRELRHKVVEAGMYGFLMNFIWDLGGKGLLGLFRDDDNEEDKIMGMISDPKFLTTLPARGTTGMNIIGNVVNQKEVSNILLNEIGTMVQDYKNINEKYGVVSPEMAWFVMNHGGKMIGWDPKVWANTYIGFEDMVMDGNWKDGDRRIIDLMYLMNSPESNRKQVAKELYKDRPVEEYMEAVKKAARYVAEGNSYEGWFVGMKSIKEAEEKKLIKEFYEKNASPEEKQAMKEKKEFEDRLKMADLEDMDKMLETETDEGRREKILNRYHRVNKDVHQSGEERAEAVKQELMGKEESTKGDGEKFWIQSMKGNDAMRESNIKRKQAEDKKYWDAYRKLEKEGKDDEAEKYYEKYGHRIDAYEYRKDLMSEVREILNDMDDMDEGERKAAVKNIRKIEVEVLRK